MVFTRSQYSVMVFNAELTRIRLEYASSDEEKPQTRQPRKYLRRVKLCPSSLPTSILAVEIDFDEAHDEWTANKRRKDNGEYVYICGAPLRKGKKCVLDCCDTIGLYSGCRKHYSWEESAHKNSMS